MESPYLGMVQYFAFNFAPKGYMECNGQLLPINQYAALFSLLGTYYGGNGVQTFALPDLRGRAIVSMGTNYSIGEQFGSSSVTLLTANMPSHTHTATGNVLANVATTGNVATPAGNFLSGGNPGGGRVPAEKQYATPPGNAQLGASVVNVSIAGGNLPISTENPYQALNCCIAIIGIFPSRN